MNKEKVVLTFLGTGTSQGVPMIGCHCEVCMSSDPRDKRLRSSVMVETGGESIVIDTGPDFRYQMLREQIERLSGVLYTHGHKDHTGGMDDLRAFNYILGKPIDIYCRPEVDAILRKDFDYAFARHRYPGVPDIVTHIIDREPFQVGDARVIPVPGFHYKLPVLGFRIGGLCYLTDMNYIEAEVIETIKGIDVLVINALRHEKHISHFSFYEALEVIKEISPGRAYLTHMSHQIGKYEEMIRELPGGVFLAYDRLKVEI